MRRRCGDAPATSRSSATVFGIHFFHHLRKRARKHAGLAAGLDGNDRLAVAAAPCTASVNRMIGRVSDLAISSASTAAQSTAINPTVIELFRIAARAP